MFYSTQGWLSFRSRPNRSRPVQKRRSFHPNLELLERREVPTTTTVAYAQHSSPYNTSSIVDYATAYNSTCGNTMTVSLVEQDETGGPSPNYDAIYYTSMDNTGSVGSRIFVAGDVPDAYGRVGTKVHWGSIDNNEVDVAVGNNGDFAITYILETWTYANSSATTPNFIYTNLYVSKYNSSGTLLCTENLDSVTDDKSDPAHRKDLQDPKVGIDACGHYTVVWSNVTQVDPIAGADGSESITLYAKRECYATAVVATSSLDVGNGSGFGAPWNWSGDRVMRLDVATNSSGNSVIVWTHMLTVTPPASSEYMALDAVYGVRFSSIGVMGTSFAVSQNADTDEPNGDPNVAINDSGSFVVDWVYIPPYTISSLPATRGVYARLYNTTGPVTNEILVEDSPHSESIPFLGTRQYYLIVADHPVGIDAAGQFIVGFEDQCTQGMTPVHDRVRVQEYNADGTARGSIINIATNGSPITMGFELSMGEDGSYVVAGVAGTPPTGDEAILAWLMEMT